MNPHTRADCDALYAQLVEAIGHLPEADAEPCWGALQHALYGVGGVCRTHALHIANDVAARLDAAERRLDAQRRELGLES